MNTRTTEEVLHSHLALRKSGNTEEDIRLNYAENCVIISKSGKFYGHHGIKKSAKELESYLGTSNYTYVDIKVEGRIAYLVWQAQSKDIEVNHGTDTFLIEDNQIKVQTIYYHVEQK